jgi:hypothetical protein
LVTQTNGASVSNWELVSWTTNLGGYEWGLEYATNLLPANTAWTPLPASSPYTNDMSGQSFFRVRAR